MDSEAGRLVREARRSVDDKRRRRIDCGATKFLASTRSGDLPTFHTIGSAPPRARRGSFRNVRELVANIDRYVTH